MLIYLQMLWKIEGRLSFDQVWKTREAAIAAFAKSWRRE